MKIKAVFKALLIAASVLLCGLTVRAEAPGNSINAKVFFGDGSSIVVEKAQFVYDWIYRSDGKYFNPPHHQTASSDFHYAETVHHVILDRVLTGPSLKRVEFVWPKPSGNGYFSPERIIITLTDGKTVIVKDPDVASPFLLGKSVEEIKDEAFFEELTLDGVGVVEGRRGKFSARIFARSGVYLKADEIIKTIEFE